jgi:signal transduction histidine kinase
LRDSTGRVSHLLGVLEDLTEETAIQEELQAARHRAESANRTKSAFLANVGHELRTPLNAILGYSDMLEELARAENRDRDSADLQRIHSAATSLLTIINEILDLSRSESVRESVRAPVDVPRLLREVNAIAEPLVRGNGNVYQVSGTHTAPYVSNEPKIRAILVNLLGNAAKFTRGGTVTLSYRIDQDNAWFRVKDTGVGIAPEAQAEIFEPFVQGDSSIGRQYGGSGLGLALCRRYCEQLDAGLDLVSAPGSGSTVTITIPSAPLAPEANTEAAPPSALLATDPR